MQISLTAKDIYNGGMVTMAYPTNERMKQRLKQMEHLLETEEDQAEQEALVSKGQ